MTRWALITLPEVDDEIQFVMPPLNWDAGQLFHLERWLDGLRECLDIIDKELNEKDDNE